MPCFPQRNTAGVVNPNANNFFGVGSSPIDKDIYGLRLDHYLTPTRRLAGPYTWDKTLQGIPNFYANVAEIQTSDLPLQRHSAFLSYSDALSSNVLLDVRGGLNFYLPNRVTRSFGFDVTQINMAARLNGLMQIPNFPRFNMSDMTAIGADQGDQLVQSNKAFSYTGSLTWIRGTHTWKFGSDNRVYQLNNTEGAAGMTFDFNRAFTQGPNTNTTGANSGFGYASFMLGTPAGGTVGFGAPVTETVKNFALFVQDDWKVTAFTFGNVTRNLPRTRSDGQSNLHLSLMKSFAIRERTKLQFRAEGFNFTNTPTFGNPAGNIDAGNFGVVTSLAPGTNSRAIQLALKLYF